MARRPAPLLVLAAIALLIVGGVGWLFYQGTASGLLGRKGRLQQVTSLPVGSDGVSELFDLTLRSSTGSGVRAMLRVPRGGSPPYPGVVLVGGMELGRRVAGLSDPGGRPRARRAGPPRRGAAPARGRPRPRGPGQPAGRLSALAPRRGARPRLPSRLELRRSRRGHSGRRRSAPGGRDRSLRRRPRRQPGEPRSHSGARWDLTVAGEPGRPRPRAPAPSPRAHALRGSHRA